MKLFGLALLVVFFACTSRPDGLRPGTHDTWVSERYGFELSIPAGASFGKSSLQPYRLVVLDEKTGMRAQLMIEEQGEDSVGVLDGVIAAIPDAQILSRGRLMLWGRPGAIAHISSPGGRVLATVVKTRKLYYLLRVEGASGVDDDAALAEAQKFLDILLDGLKIS
jgi:hypothetical protein